MTEANDLLGNVLAVQALQKQLLKRLVEMGGGQPFAEAIVNAAVKDIESSRSPYADAAVAYLRSIDTSDWS
jgi:hypothetical protein